MKNTLLLPRGCRIAGLIMLIPSVVLFIASTNGSFVFNFLRFSTTKYNGDLLGGNDNFTDEFGISLCILSLFMIAFSKQKIEDEYIKHIRLRSLQIGVYANYAIFILLTFTVFGGWYLDVLLLNIVTTLVLFILVFYSSLHIKPLFNKTATA